MPKINKKISKIENNTEIPFDTSLLYKNQRHEATNEEKLFFLFKTLLNKGERLPNFFDNDDIMIKESELIKTPYFFENTIYDEILHLMTYVKENKDFYRKNNLINYKPDFEYDQSGSCFSFKYFLFKDFTNDFMQLFLKDGISSKFKKTKDDFCIKNIDILEDKTENKSIVLYLNENYNNPLEFNRHNYYISLYNLARDGEVDYSKGLYDYFNSNKSNPIYKNTGFKLSKILKKDKGYITPKISIKLRTQKYISQKNK